MCMDGDKWIVRLTVNRRMCNPKKLMKKTCERKAGLKKYIIRQGEVIPIEFLVQQMKIKTKILISF